jgi:hypothetical protein
VNAFGILFVAANLALLLRLPRRWAFFPLLMGGIYMTPGQAIELGPFHFTAIRLLVGGGILRVLMRGERISGGASTLDRMMVIWAAWVVGSSFFHSSPGSAVVTRLGIAWECLGFYWLMRVFVRNIDDFLLVAQTLLVLLIPLAAEMMIEKATGRNLFAALGYVAEQPAVRNGRVRAQGPFAHAILAGTAAAVSLPLAFLCWRRHRKLALAGLVATGGMVIASASSGPLMTLFSILGALGIWKIRHHLRSIRWAAILGLLTLNMVMHDPVYYLMARIDLSGGSTGYFRAALIHSALGHLGEWWFAGTDYTRHWMGSGVAANTAHTDITNHYLGMGVLGGLPLMLLFIGVLCAAFAVVGRARQRAREEGPGQEFVVWTMGSILFGHAATFMSVSYFDQTNLFLYMLLAGIAALQEPQSPLCATAAEGAVGSSPEYACDAYGCQGQFSTIIQDLGGRETVTSYDCEK